MTETTHNNVISIGGVRQFKDYGELSAAFAGLIEQTRSRSAELAKQIDHMRAATADSDDVGRWRALAIAFAEGQASGLAAIRQVEENLKQRADAEAARRDTAQRELDDLFDCPFAP
jgi:hypothetical protein